MSYLVLEAPSVREIVDRLSPRVPRDYARVVSILSETPKPQRGFSAITEGVSASGRRYYQYLDNVLPLIIQYRVYEPDNAWQRGLVWVARALRLDDEWLPLE